MDFIFVWILLYKDMIYVNVQNKYFVNQYNISLYYIFSEMNDRFLIDSPAHQHLLKEHSLILLLHVHMK